MGEAATEHLVHGMGTTLEAPAWPAITATEAEVMLSSFPDAGDMVALRWHSPRPFSAAALVKTDTGEFILKRHHRSLRTRDALAEEHDFMAHLRSARLQVPEVMVAPDGSGTVAHGDWVYELHRKSPGLDLYRDRTSWTSFLSPRHAHHAGVALARLHRAAAGYTAAPRGPHPLVATFTILPAADPLAATDAYVADRPALSAFLAGRPWRPELARLFAVLGHGLPERLRGQVPLWTHNDWHPSNLLWSPDGSVRTIFDFGLATRTCALHDIATAIERTAIPWLNLNEPADPQIAVALLAGYQSVLPLSNADVETIVRLLPLVHIEFALSEVDYFAGTLKDDELASVAWQVFLVEHADWFLTAAGQDFLRQFERGTLERKAA
jgi:Ser/Thr protein kinase RdoA (MazF antagonist)